MNGLKVGIPLILILLVSACARQGGPQGGTGTAGCEEPAPGNELLTNEEYGYCLIYPDDFIVEGTAQSQMIDLAPGSQGMGPRMPFVIITATEAGDRSAADMADSLARDFPDFTLPREELTVGGEPAVMLDDLPGQDLNRQLFVVRDGTLYTFMFVPTDEAQGEVYTRMEALYATVVTSFNFLPAP